MKITKLEAEKMGTTYEVINDSGVKLVTSPEGARLLDWVVPVDGGRDLVIGYDTIAGHKEARYYGATIGPVAGRIAGTQFTIDGTEYQTEDNDGGNTLHGGFHGLDTETWDAETFENEEGAGVIYRTQRKDGDGGFPGNVTYTVTYTLTLDNRFKITYDAVTDKPTLFNPTNHGYFNLTGDNKQAIDEHLLQIHAENVAETNADITTTGEKITVEGTKFDFRTAKKIGETLMDDPFLLHHDKEVDLVLTSPDQKVTMTVKTDQPAVVIYTTRDGEVGASMKTGPLVYHGGIAIETQGVPGTEKYPQFGEIVLRPEQPYHAETIYQVAF